MKNVTIAVLIAVIAVGGTLGALAASRTVDTTANVDVTVWQSVSNGALYLSTRPEGGGWTTFNTPLDMSTLSDSGRFRQGSAITVAVPVSVTVDVDGAPTPAPASPSFGEWEFFTAANVDGELTGYQLVGESTHHQSWEALPYMYLRCSSSGGRSVYITTNALLFNDNETDRITVAYRLSGGVKQFGEWFSDETGDSALFAPGTFVSYLESQYAGGEVLFVSAEDDYSRYQSEFTLTGIHDVIDALECW